MVGPGDREAGERLPPQDETSVTSTTTSEGSTPANFAIMFWYNGKNAFETRPWRCYVYIV